jgi:hypothetical protein
MSEKQSLEPNLSNIIDIVDFRREMLSRINSMKILVESAMPFSEISPGIALNQYQLQILIKYGSHKFGHPATIIIDEFRGIEDRIRERFVILMRLESIYEFQIAFKRYQESKSTDDFKKFSSKLHVLAISILELIKSKEDLAKYPEIAERLKAQRLLFIEAYDSMGVFASSISENSATLESFFKLEQMIARSSLIMMAELLDFAPINISSNPSAGRKLLPD